MSRIFPQSWCEVEYLLSTRSTSLTEHSLQLDVYRHRFHREILHFNCSASISGVLHRGPREGTSHNAGLTEVSFTLLVRCVRRQ